MAENIPTIGEMERGISQSIQAFYRNKLGCRVEKVDCHIVNKQVSTTIQNPITPVEKLLYLHAEGQFISELRDRIDRIVK